MNAAAYRAFLLTSASQVFCNEDYWKIAERNLNFVLENQNPRRLVVLRCRWSARFYRSLSYLFCDESVGEDSRFNWASGHASKRCRKVLNITLKIFFLKMVFLNLFPRRHA